MKRNKVSWRSKAKFSKNNVINSKASLTLEISSSNMDRKTMIH
jgi:hypothetical protein